MTRLFAIIAAGLVTGSAMGGTTITPMQGSLGNPFNDGMMHGCGWNGVEGGSAGSLIGNLYDNILTVNGGAATVWCPGPFNDRDNTEAFVDWTSPTAQWGDDLHGLAGPGGNQPAGPRWTYVPAASPR